MKEETPPEFNCDDIIGQSESIKQILGQAAQVASTDSTVLLLGETGTGKELLARHIHRVSARRDKPLITVNCGALPPSLIEGELFGREKGAYTGALTRMIGRFEEANGGTLFLDEIGDLPFELQIKLLRVLQEGDFEPLGSSKTRHSDVRIISATNRDLLQSVREGLFRADLFYRLSVFPITVPPLRDRKEDIPLLVWAFIQKFELKMGKRIDTVSAAQISFLKNCAWPGNVRELQNVIEYAMIITKGKCLSVNMPKGIEPEPPPSLTLRVVERRHIRKVLERTGWRISEAAKLLGLRRTTLHSKMKKLDIHRPASGLYPE